jgi:hypothetical protein
MFSSKQEIKPGQCRAFLPVSNMSENADVKLKIGLNRQYTSLVGTCNIYMYERGRRDRMVVGFTIVSTLRQVGRFLWSPSLIKVTAMK